MKHRFIRNKIHSMSLGARIIGVFFFTAIAILIIFSIFFSFISDKNQDQALPKMIVDYGQMLVQEMGQPAQLNSAKKIADRTGLTIYIKQQNSWFSTSGKTINDRVSRDKEVIEIQQNGHLFRLQFWHGSAFLSVIKETETIIFELSFRQENATTRFIFIGFLLSLITVIYLAYRIVRYLIMPIQSIELGVLNFSKGQLGYRIQKQRNDDLGVLTEHINQMASQLERMLEAKRQLLLAISHELRTPMTRLQIALDLPCNNKNKNRMYESLKQMDTLLSELIESEKLSGNHQSLDCQQVEINELITSLLEQEYEDYQLIHFSSNNDNSLANIDAMRIRLLLRNLINNAIKYGEGEPITVSTDVNEQNVIIKVTDQGVGISTSEIEKVFEPFYRVDQARQRKTGGTGLGLYLAQLIVDAHKGKIAIESTLGKGTTVLVTLKKAE